MANLTLDDLTQHALALEIITPAQLQEMWTTFGTQNVEPEQFLQESVKKGFLTNYQIERLRNSETTGFFFGEYKVQYHLGAGTFARVYRATHKDTGKIVAVKVLRNRFNDDPTIINHFVHEAELGIELRHPNIVPIYEVNSEGKLHYMVMDFVEGQTLREFLKVRKKVDPKVSTRIVTDICSGLDYAFKRGLQHRDLKLSNVLLSSMGKAMLVDFGLAAITENNDFSTHGEIRNQRSIDYAALERTTGVKRDDKRSDIYFLGCIYYNLLTGEAPLLETKDRMKRADKNRFYNVKPIQMIDPMLPRAVTLVVNKAMSMDVEKRYQTMGEMLTDLEVCARRLSDGTANDGISVGFIEQGLAQSAPVVSKDKQKSVMIVDSNTELQGVFRESLKKAGYRVLVATSPERAVDRLLDDVSVADVALFNAQSLGQGALAAFNRLSEDTYTSRLPMILLLDERQGDFVASANRDKHRIVLVMPITMKIMKDNIGRLLGTIPSDQPPAPQVEIPIDFLTPAEPGPESSNEQNEDTHDYIFANEEEVELELDEDAEDEEDDLEDAEDLNPAKKSFGYKETLANRDDDSDPLDALYEVGALALVKPNAAKPIVESVVETTTEPVAEAVVEAIPEPIVEPVVEPAVEEVSVPDASTDFDVSLSDEPDSSDVEQHTQLENDEIAIDGPIDEPQPLQQLEPEPEINPYQGMGIDELREAVSTARLQFAEATRAEIDANRRVKEAVNAKRQAEESFRTVEAELNNAKSRLEHATEKFNEANLAVESLNNLKMESQQSLDESMQAREHAETVLVASKDVLQQVQEEYNHHEESHKKTQEEALAASEYFDRSQEAQTKSQELKSALDAALELLENANKSTEASASEVSETKSRLENFASTLETLNLQFSEVRDKAQLAAAEYEAAAAFQEESQNTADTLRTQAETSMEDAIAKEKTAEDAEEAARIAAEKAVIARNEAKQAMIIAGDDRIKSERAAEEVRAAELFVAESSQKMESAKAAEEETRNTLEQAEIELERLKAETEEKEKVVFDITAAEEEARTQWEVAKKAHEDSEHELSEALVAAGVAEELRNKVEQFALNRDIVSKQLEEAKEEVHKAELALDELVKHEEGCRLRLEKTLEESAKHKTELEEAVQLRQEAQNVYDESFAAHQKAESDLNEAKSHEEEANRNANRQSTEKEKARSAEEAASNVLAALEGASSESSDSSEPATGTFKQQTSVEDRVAAAIRARVEAALAARKK